MERGERRGGLGAHPRDVRDLTAGIDVVEADYVRFVSLFCLVLRHSLTLRHAPAARNGPFDQG
jgi:hypothetical protein